MADEEATAALAKERHVIAKLLERAEVPVRDAESLVVEALLAWDAGGRRLALIDFVDARCRRYAKQRGRDYVGVKEMRAVRRKLC